MRSFKVGELVVVHKPENENVYPGWHPDMDEHIETIGTVLSESSSEEDGLPIYTVRLRDGETYYYHHNWLTPSVPEPLPNPLGDALERLSE